MADPIYTSGSLIAAARNSDLIYRITALGQAKGHSQADVESCLTRIVGTSVDAEGNTLASLLEFAETTYEPTPAPGADPGKVRDDQIVAALAAVLAPTE